MMKKQSKIKVSLDSSSRMTSQQVSMRQHLTLIIIYFRTQPSLKCSKIQRLMLLRLLNHAFIIQSNYLQFKIFRSQPAFLQIWRKLILIIFSSAMARFSKSVSSLQARLSFPPFQIR
ncbi:hypothetical protein FGO68_gene8394 [Halteria grandinella]|uniref:Uncharacterized protein n=1 Tax=Halteria grandinella TaxID=5974 RepID=A0A8J8NXX4_HALGN|nr:hypothetical protein FGO68_gene8394 [Halteria grandinella]